MTVSQSHRPTSSPWTREELERLRDGDESLRARFFDEAFDRVHALVARRIRNPHEAEDLVQEVFLKLHRSLSSYDPARALEPWVNTIAMNTLRDHWRAGARRELASELTPELEPELAVERDPAAPLERKELSERLKAAIARLSDLSRKVLVFRAFEGLAFEDISRLVGRSEVAVRKRYSRAVESLRETMALPGAL
ncbi:MAG: RNA polymerase sigma factor [Planctomycetes bacterium]|nr:RNA polymerase sigma factor [Planctomycetota bacterium]